MTVYQKSQLIEKEDITSFSFPKTDVLQDKFQIDLRSKNIERASKLGNKFKNKVHIFFEDNKSLKRVETTIWGVTEKYLILKRNTVIPIKRVLAINI